LTTVSAAALAASFDIDRAFHALGDPTRRAMVERLSRGPAAVSELARPFAITLTGAAQHLKVLSDSGLVRTEKVGRVRTCRLETASLAALEQWIGLCRSEWEQRLDRLGQVLAEDD
jgi:DNA-binding transcriptional ArsR family regulator